MFEAQPYVDRLNVIEREVFLRKYASRLDYEAKANEFRSIVKTLHKENIALSVVKHRGLPRVFSVKTPDVDDSWVYFAPPTKFNNQCTTRALYFCLNETIPYDAIRAEQNRIAHHLFGIGRCRGWNYKSVWEKILLDRDFVKISLRRKIRAKAVAKIFGNIDSRILCHTSGHCLSVYNSKVYDSWNSTNKLVDYVICRRDVAKRVHDILGY